MADDPLGWDARDADLLERINALDFILFNTRPYVLREWVVYVIKCMASSRHRYRVEELESHRTGEVVESVEMTEVVEDETLKGETKDEKQNH